MKEEISKIHKNLSGKYLEVYLKIGSILLSDSNIRCAILSGSILNGEQGKTSDLDIIAITKEDLYQRKQISMSGVFIELFLYSKKELYQSFRENDYQNMNMVGNGFVMFNKGNILGPIRKKARYLFEKGPKKLNLEQKTYLQYLVWDSYCDVVDMVSVSPMSAFSLVHKNIWYSLEVYYKLNSMWFCKSKRMLNEIKNINEDIYNNLVGIYSCSLKDIKKAVDYYRAIVKIVIHPHNIDKHFTWESRPRKSKLSR